MILTREDLAKLAAKIDEFSRSHQDYDENQQPSVCACCEEIGVGAWTCYCRRDD